MEGEAAVITRDSHQLRSIETGRFVRIECVSQGFAAGETPKPIQWWHVLVEDPREADYWPKAHIERARQEGLHTLDLALFENVPAPACACCGSQYRIWSGSSRKAPWLDLEQPGVGIWRCRKHVGRNPCAIEGCTRTRAADRTYGDDQWLCAEHWRRFCPPRSMRRRAYHAFFRKGIIYLTPELRPGR